MSQSSRIAATPKPPYYAVIFTSVRSDEDHAAYSDASARMVELAAQQPGFLGVESAREGVGITVSYWRGLEDIAAWKKNAEHQAAQRSGRERWYTHFQTRICKVERDYGKSP